MRKINDKYQNSNDKINQNFKFQISKQNVLSFIICHLCLFWILCFGICHLAYAQDNAKLADLTKQVMEAKSNKELYPALENLTDLYFKENKYNEYIEFLKSLAEQKKELAAAAGYYIALSRYYQLEHLEEAQLWEEYFNQGNVYRDELTGSLKKSISQIDASDPLGIYARILLWKFHYEQQGSQAEAALVDLMDFASSYAKETNDAEPLKSLADELSAAGEKAKAKQFYKIYLDRTVSSETSDDRLKEIAAGFYQQGSMDLAQSIYDIYTAKIIQYPKDKSLPLLIEIAKAFAYSAEGGSAYGGKVKGPSSPVYAEKIFEKIEEIGGKDAFSEDLLYLRAINSEKIKEYGLAKRFYDDLATRFPQGPHADEACFKAGIIAAYILTDLDEAKSYFEKLAKKDSVSPQVISGLYQLGILAEWVNNYEAAKTYFNKLIDLAGANFGESVFFANERIKEINAAKPMEYNLKSFLDAALKPGPLSPETSRVDLNVNPSGAGAGSPVQIIASGFSGASGCMSVEMQYLWSGDTGKDMPSGQQASFTAQYADPGTKVIGLVVMSSSGVIGKDLSLIDIK
ncbi:MAG: hypothetical protein MUC39_00765 [Candidatus Omnitrophica bacterium]|jgi:TolA-binding protein|nr:hypothetical protein [Candidatus Omnitrophota bacterium]